MAAVLLFGGLVASGGPIGPVEADTTVPRNVRPLPAAPLTMQMPLLLVAGATPGPVATMLMPPLLVTGGTPGPVPSMQMPILLVPGAATPAAHS